MSLDRWLSSDPSAKTEDDTKTMRDCGKSSWMPDQSCQTCYNCEASFSFFVSRQRPRRRIQPNCLTLFVASETSLPVVWSNILLEVVSTDEQAHSASWIRH